MKKLFSALAVVLICNTAAAQKPTVAQIKGFLDTTSNVPGFLTFIKKKFYIDSTIVFNLNNYKTQEEKIVATGKLGKTYGPFTDKKKKNYLVKLLYTTPSTYYHIKHILIDSNVFKGSFANKLADSIIAKINDGRATFQEMVSTYSGDLFSQSKGGDMGWYIKGGSLPEINRELIKRKTGELFTVKTRGGLHIFKIEATKEAPAFGMYMKVIL